jgi:hypothetical protein
MKPLAVCASFENEAPNLLEWIASYRVIGFDHHDLSDNDSSDPRSQPRHHLAYEEERFEHFAAISHLADTTIKGFAQGVRALLGQIV